MLSALMLLATLSGPMTVQEQNTPAPQEHTCLPPEQITEVYTKHNLQVKRLEGEALGLFNANYSKEFGRTAPTDVDVVLLVERGEFTQIFSFIKGCMNGNGKAETAMVHKLLNLE